MASKKFTEEEMNHLRASSYVLDVSPSIVHFSVAFKREFWQSLQEGNEPREVIVKMGIDPEILGKNRINGLRTLVRNEFLSGKGFRDIDTCETFYKNFTNPEVKIKHLEQQIAYKDQEIEFLKKIASLGREEAGT